MAEQTLCTGCERYTYTADSGPCPVCFPYRYRIIAKCGDVVVTDERTNSGSVMQDTVRALIREGGNVITVFTDGEPETIDARNTGLGVEADAILADFFALETAAKGGCKCGHGRSWHGDCIGPCRRNDCSCRSFAA